MPSPRVLTVPNLVSLVRLGMVPVFWWLLLAEDRVAAAAILVFAVGATDWVDGYLARRLDQVSRLGAILDPVADRIFIAAAVVGGLVAGVLPDLIALPLIVREAIMALVTLFLAVKRAEVLAVRWLGKVATFLLYGAIPGFYLAAAGVMPGLFLPVAWLTGSVGLVLYWSVFVQYLGDARAALARLESPPDPQET